MPNHQPKDLFSKEDLEQTHRLLHPKLLWLLEITNVFIYYPALSNQRQSNRLRRTTLRGIWASSTEWSRSYLVFVLVVSGFPWWMFSLFWLIDSHISVLVVKPMFDPVSLVTPRFTQVRNLSIQFLVNHWLSNICILVRPRVRPIIFVYLVKKCCSHFFQFKANVSTFAAIVPYCLARKEYLVQTVPQVKSRISTFLLVKHTIFVCPL